MLPPIFGVIFDGIAYGMLLFVLSVGLSVTLGLMNFVNLAHCAFAMLGGYISVFLVNDYQWPFLATLPVAFIVTAIVSVFFERVFYRRLYRSTAGPDAGFVARKPQLLRRQPRQLPAIPDRRRAGRDRRAGAGA
jgi:branched-subunit amino acid ABC-type transport system permease component